MLAYRRADVRDLNDAAHTLMLRAGRLGPDALEARRARVPRRRPRPLSPQRRHGSASATASAQPSSTLDDGGAHAAHRRGRASARSTRATRPSTSSTATRSPATPPRAPPSSAPSSSSPTRAHSRSGATSPAPAPAPKPASTSPARHVEREAHGREPDRPGAPERARPRARYLRLGAARARPGEGTSDATARLRRATRAARAGRGPAPQQRLAQAEAKLDQLGWRGRRRHGAELRPRSHCSEPLSASPTRSSPSRCRHRGRSSYLPIATAQRLREITDSDADRWAKDCSARARPNGDAESNSSCNEATHACVRASWASGCASKPVALEAREVTAKRGTDEQAARPAARRNRAGCVGLFAGGLREDDALDSARGCFRTPGRLGAG